MPTSAPTGRACEAVAVLVFVGKEVGREGELVMLISPGLDVVEELKVVEDGLTALLVAFPIPPVVGVMVCVLSQLSQAEVAKLPMARISVIGHAANKQGPTRLAIAPCPEVPQIQEVELTSPQAEMIAVERHPAMYPVPQGDSDCAMMARGKRRKRDNAACRSSIETEQCASFGSNGKPFSSLLQRSDEALED